MYLIYKICDFVNTYGAMLVDLIALLLAII